MQILKENKYKRVKLHAGGERWLVEKTFIAFSCEQRCINTQYLYNALVWFYQEFQSIISVPEPVKIDLDNSSVYMEYLKELPKAAHISSRSISRVNDFFEHCYQIRSDQGFLRDMHGSVAITPHIQTLLDSDFPQSLGFKGDLRENLVIAHDRAILADIDSIALEPLGLSELTLYAELACSFSPRALIAGLFFPLPVPVAYQHLDKLQASQINAAAVELAAVTMHDLSPSITNFKVNRATSVLASLVQRHYVR